MINKLVKTVFRALEKISQDNIEPFQTKVRNVQHKLEVSIQMVTKSTAITPILKPLESAIKTMVHFT